MDRRQYLRLSRLQSRKAESSDLERERFEVQERRGPRWSKRRIPSRIIVRSLLRGFDNRGIPFKKMLAIPKIRCVCITPPVIPHGHYGKLVIKGDKIT